MQDPHIDPSLTPSIEKPDPKGLDPASEKGKMPRRRERHTVRLVLGLSGLLGVAWAVAIATRYPNLIPG